MPTCGTTKMYQFMPLQFKIRKINDSNQPATNHRPTGNNNPNPLCLKSQWYFRVGTNISPHEILPSQNFARPLLNAACHCGGPAFTRSRCAAYMPNDNILPRPLV